MKKIISVAILFFVIANTVCAQTAGDPPKAAIKPKTVPPSKSGKMLLSLTGGQLVLNKTDLSRDWKLAPMIKLFGSAGRVRDGYNITHSYDDYGIALFEKSNEKKPTGVVIEFQVFISQGENNDVTPLGLYTGRLEIEKKEVTEDLTLDDLRELLVGYKESKSYTDHNYRFAKAGIYMYVQYDDDDEVIQKISIGPDKTK